MKKFKCYKCGTIAGVEDSAVKACCPNCGTVCILTPTAPAPASAPVAPAQTATNNSAPATVPAAVPAPPIAETPVPPAAPVVNQHATTPAIGNAATMAFTRECSERSAAVSILAPFVPFNEYKTLHSAIMNAPIERVREATGVKLRSAKVTLLLSLMFFYTGIDRLYAGYIALGICKWIFGACTAFIWNFVDIFLAYKGSRKKNLERIIAALGMQPVPSNGKKAKK